MIRRYPNLLAEEIALHEPNITSKATGMPHTGSVSDPTAMTALRELPPVHRNELNAVRQAIEETKGLKNGDERMEMVRLIFWAKSHTVVGVAMKLHRSERTIQEWHRQFIRLVAKKYGLI